MKHLLSIHPGALIAGGVATATLLLAACESAPRTAAPAPQATVTAVAAQQTPSHTGSSLSAVEMAKGHVEGVKSFPAKTAGQGNQPLAPTIADDGTKVFELTATEIQWETEPGKIFPALAYNGQVPGPQLRAALGDKVRIVLKNRMSEPTGLHLHGFILPNGQDGVPGLTQPPVMPNEDFTYEFTVRNSGSNMYHSHFGARQVTMGLLGAFIIDDPKDPKVDVDYTMVLNDGPLSYTINGKGFPATEPIVAKPGQKVRVRYLNEGSVPHPMHLHGMPQTVIAKDGWLMDYPYKADTILVGPGERYDVVIEATEAGAWAYHCHILSHAESEHGMFGMVTAFVVKD